jgi:hypothetical protein
MAAELVPVVAVTVEAEGLGVRAWHSRVGGRRRGMFAASERERECVCCLECHSWL